MGELTAILLCLDVRLHVTHDLVGNFIPGFLISTV